MSDAYFQFTGNGGQQSIYYDRKILDTSKNREVLDTMDRICPGVVGRMFDKKERKLITDEKEIEVATVGTGLLLAEDLEEKGLECAGTGGLSLGEITSAAFAGAIKDKSGTDYKIIAMYLAENRAEIMLRCAQKALEYIDYSDSDPAFMAAVFGVSKQQLRSYCTKINRSGKRGNIDISNENPGHYVVSGAPAAITKIVHTIERRHPEAVIRKLKTQGPWHNKFYMQAAAKELIELFESFSFQKPSKPFYSTAFQRFEDDPSRIRKCLTFQVFNPVRSVKGLWNIISAGYRRIVNPGPGKVIEPMVEKVGAESVDKKKIENLEQKIEETFKEATESSPSIDPQEDNL